MFKISHWVVIQAVLLFAASVFYRVVKDVPDISFVFMGAGMLGMIVSGAIRDLESRHERVAVEAQQQGVRIAALEAEILELKKKGEVKE